MLGNTGNGAITFGTVDIDGIGGSGIAIGSSNGVVNINGGTIGGSNDPTGGGIYIGDSSGTISIGASVAKTTGGKVVEIANLTGGTVTLSGNLSATGGADNGIYVHGNTGGAVNFTGQSITLTTGASTAVQLVGNTGATINFNSAAGGNGLDITTTSGTGFNAGGGGTVSVQGTGNTITTTTGMAVDVANTIIGAGGLNWQSITTGAATTGVSLTNTGTSANGVGSGAFTVTGNGTDDSGGTMTGVATGYRLSGTGALNLTQVNIVNVRDDGIFGTNVNGLTLNSVEIDGIADAGPGANIAATDRAVEFNNLTGTATVTNSTFSNTAGHLFNIYNSAGTLNLTVTGSTFSGSQVSGAGGDDGLLIEANDTSTIIASVTGSTFSNNEGDHFQFGTNGGASTAHITFNNNTLTNNPGANSELLGGGITISPSGNSDLTFEIKNNTITGNNQGGAIDVTTLASTASMLAQGTISGNVIGNPSVANSGSLQAVGISIENNGNGTLTALVDGNSVYQWGDLYGIEVFARAGTDSGGVINATIRNNTVQNPGTFALNGIRVTGGTSADTDVGLINLDVINNTTDTSLTNDIRVSARANVDIRFAGYLGSMDDTAAIQAYLEARNTGSETASVAILGGVPDLTGLPGSVLLPAAPLVP